METTTKLRALALVSVLAPIVWAIAELVSAVLALIPSTTAL